MDWSKLLYDCLQVVIPLLVAALVPAAIMQWAKVWTGAREYFNKSAPKWIVGYINDFAPIAVSAVEQLKKNGVIPDNAAALEQAKKFLNDYLVASGYSNLEPFAELIEASIESAVHDLPHTESDKPQ